MRRASLVSVLAFLLSCGFVECAPSQPLAGSALSPPPASVSGGVALEVWAKGLKEPVAFAYAPRDPKRRIFIGEKPGRVIALDSSGKPAGVVLDITARVSNGSEQGLLGLAFHPDWAENGRFVVHYTDVKGDSRVVEYRIRKDTEKADEASARELLFVDQPYANHNGGHVIFGPDGRLWVGFGDGGWAGDPHGNGQRDDTHLGKMVVLSAGSTGNPVAVQKGLRNPWRYQFDRKTGDLYIGDVGQNQWEEVDVLAASATTGVNLGWNAMEGNHCYKRGCDASKYVAAAMEYSHRDGCSITGGFVYRGKALPQLDGHYFYADYCTGLLRGFHWQGKGKPVADSWDWKEHLDPESKLARLTSFGEDESGELYLLSQDGVIWKLVPSR